MTLSLSFLFSYMRTSTKDEYEEIGRTEVINDDLNPNFLEKILLEYKFEMTQYLKFELCVRSLRCF